MSDDIKKYINLITESQKDSPKDELKESKIDEAMMPVINSAQEYKKYIANHWDEFVHNVKMLYPADQKEVYGIFIRFLKNQPLDNETVMNTEARISKKIQHAGGPYDEMAQMLTMIGRFVPKADNKKLSNENTEMSNECSGSSHDIKKITRLSK